MSIFWSNNGKGNTVNIKDVVAVLDKDYEPLEYQMILLTKTGKIVWLYSSKSVRDNDIPELRKLINEFQNKIA